MNQAELLWGLLFGSVGFAYFLYGKKQKAVVPLLCGLALMLVPYFVSNAWLLALGGALLCALPWIVRV